LTDEKLNEIAKHLKEALTDSDAEIIFESAAIGNEKKRRREMFGPDREHAGGGPSLYCWRLGPALRCDAWTSTT
jgi:hypothetical protein